ncbi:MAG: hypothetical protein JWN48_1232 [Myxococcaceae bacterium]|nr:hypothetical protein [Myxococcaceae bacterium]
MRRHLSHRLPLGSIRAVGLAILGSAIIATGCSDDPKQAGESSARGLEGDASTAVDARAPALDGRASSGPQLTADGAIRFVDGGAAGDVCNELEVKFESRPPSVFILVDRSSSMFEHGLWEPLKSGVLEMVQRLQTEVRFGFSTYTGQNGGVCPDLTTATAVAQNNYASIAAAYNALGAPSYKGETPTARAIDQTAAVLKSDSDPGPKFILLVTDGEPDFCDDANVTCARDAVVGAVQAAYRAGIGTYIFSVGGGVEQSHLRDVANAGTGQKVEDHAQAVAQQCQGSQGSYGTPAGSAPFFEPNVNEQQLLVDSLASVVSGARSCTFDLQGKIKIDLGEADSGMVQIDGVTVPFGGTDGYRMNSATQLELLGASCQRLKQQDVQRVSIHFPCQAVIAI